MRTTVKSQIGGQIEINYELEGSGPVIVLTHGLGGSQASWETTSAALRDGYTVLRWDVRGFGDSEKPDGPTSTQAWAADLSGLLHALAIPRAVILGHSMGGVVSQRFVLDYAEQAHALILVSTSSEVNAQAKTGWLQIAERVEAEGFTGAPVVGGLAAGTNEAQAQDLTVNQNDPASYAAAARAIAGYNFTQELSSIACPTLIVQGLDDKLTPPGGSVIMSRQIPNVRLEMIENCGHDVPREQFQPFVRLVRDFLDTLPPA